MLVDCPNMRHAPLRYPCAIKTASLVVLGADQGCSRKNHFMSAGVCCGGRSRFTYGRIGGVRRSFQSTSPNAARTPRKSAWAAIARCSTNSARNGLTIHLSVQTMRCYSCSSCLGRGRSRRGLGGRLRHRPRTASWVRVYKFFMDIPN